ncbi:MAG TPA: hypothetical protein VIC62_05150 [Nakamurella sp.]|jgi:hypothetical protein
MEPAGTDCGTTVEASRDAGFFAGVEPDVADRPVDLFGAEPPGCGLPDAAADEPSLGSDFDAGAAAATRGTS